jgi:hypothetical protein
MSDTALRYSPLAQAKCHRFIWKFGRTSRRWYVGAYVPFWALTAELGSRHPVRSQTLSLQVNEEKM